MNRILDQRDGDDRRDGNGNGGPWWSKDLRVAGPLAIIALGLVYVLAVDVRGDAKQAAATAAVVRSELASHYTHTEQLHTTIEGYMRVQLLLLRQLCTNSAKNADDRRACFQP